jgi:hypothetical protein
VVQLLAGAAIKTAPVGFTQMFFSEGCFIPGAIFFGMCQPVFL